MYPTLAPCLLRQRIVGVVKRFSNLVKEMINKNSTFGFADQTGDGMTELNKKYGY